MIVAGLNDSNSAAKDAALGALLAWKGYEAAEQLFNICKSNPSDQVFDKVLNRYVELVSAPTRTGENRLLDLRDAMEIARTNEQKATILKQIQKTNTFQGLLYASKFLDASDQAVKSAAAPGREIGSRLCRSQHRDGQPELYGRQREGLPEPHHGYARRRGCPL